jgi:nucleotide-binding universal stress UspA family protein
MKMRMRILIGYDGSESADTALADLRKAGLPREAEALILTVSDVLMPPSAIESAVVQPALTARSVAVVRARMETQAVHKLEEAKQLAAKASDRVRSYFPDWDVQALALAGTPATELMNKAADWKADLVVVGSRGRSALGRLILGSVSKKVVTDSHHSVRVARLTVDQRESRPPRVMIGVDGSAESENAVREVGMRVWPKGTEVRIIAVDDGTSPKRIARVLPTAAALIASSNEKALEPARLMVEWAERELRAIGLQVSVAIEKGDPQRVLIDEARKWEADSIFDGSRRFDGTFERFWLGSVSTALVTNAPASVEVVRTGSLELSVN